MTITLRLGSRRLGSLGRPTCNRRKDRYQQTPSLRCLRFRPSEHTARSRRGLHSLSLLLPPYGLGRLSGYSSLSGAPNFMKTRSRSPESATQDTPRSLWKSGAATNKAGKTAGDNNNERTALARTDHSLILARRGADYRVCTETESVY